MARFSAQFPPPLRPGETIGVMSPSSYVEEADIEQSKNVLENKGYSVFVHPQTYARNGQMAGTDAQKLEALYELWSREDIKAVWAAGGGNRALCLLDRIDYERLKQSPKPFIGFSDATVLLNAITARTGLATFHGPVFKGLHSATKADFEQSLALLGGEAAPISLNGAEILQDGVAEGHLIGGCLSLFQYLAGTEDCPPLDGALLFLEDSGDHLSRFDRMFAQLARLGVFERIGGLMLGEFHDLQEGARPFGHTLNACIMHYVKNPQIPVISGAPFGHGAHLPTFPLGANASIDTKRLTLSF